MIDHRPLCGLAKAAVESVAVHDTELVIVELA